MDHNPGFLQKRIQEMLSISLPYNCSGVEAMLDSTSTAFRLLCVGLISSTSPPVLKEGLDQRTPWTLQARTTQLFYALKENTDFFCIYLL